MIHETITQNLLTLIRAGAFMQTEGAAVVAMSPHKWRTLLAVAERMHVCAYVAWGAHLLNGDPHLHPMMNGLDHQVKEFNTADAHLFNIMTQKKLDAVREEEMNSREISEDTLVLLDIIIRNADDIIVSDVTMEGIIALGVFIREHRDSIDWDKLRSWLSRVGLVRLAALEASMLMDVFHFDVDEVPFASKHYKHAEAMLVRTVEKALEKHSFSMLTRMDVAMLETISHRFMSAISLVTDIEE